MQFVSRILEAQHVWWRSCGFLRLAFGQEISVFMLHLHIAHVGGIEFDEGEVTGNPETAFAPRVQKSLCLIPAVKADAETVRLQHAIKFGEGGEQPA